MVVGEAAASFESDTVWLLETNLDDTSGEVIGHAMELLLAAGALDAYTTSIGMKKNRPGVMLSVLAPVTAVDRLEQVLFQHTSTLGVRRTRVARHVLPRAAHAVDTRLGNVTGKLARLPDGSTRFSPEYESAKTLADAQGVSLDAVYSAAQAAFRLEE
jgi:uncharacterized protein (DUF111 family)